MATKASGVGRHMALYKPNDNKKASKITKDHVLE